MDKNIMIGDIVTYDGTDPNLLVDIVRVMVTGITDTHAVILYWRGEKDENIKVNLSTLTKTERFPKKRFSTFKEFDEFFMNPDSVLKL